MAASVNKAILVGNLGKDPDVRRRQDESLVVTLSLATSTSWRDKQTGEMRERTHWHRVVISKQQDCVFAEKLRKGTKVYVEGCIRTRKWTDRSGTDQYTTEVSIEGFTHCLKSVAGGGGRSAPSEDDYGSEDDQEFGAPQPDYDDEESFIPMR